LTLLYLRILRNQIALMESRSHSAFTAMIPACNLIRKWSFKGTVPANKNYVTCTVPANKNYVTGTVPANKNYVTGTVGGGR
jgi:hypothetical protein